jgi:hypothetical protein
VLRSDESRNFLLRKSIFLTIYSLFRPTTERATMMRSALTSRRHLLAGMLALSICSFVGGRAFAGPLSLTLLSEGAGTDVTITYNGATPDYPNGFTLTGFAGKMNLQLGSTAQFIGFCVDLAHFVSTGQTFSVNAYSTNDPTNGLTNGGQIAYLANTFGPQSLSNVQAAGLQIAIWSELYDNGNGFTSGTFQYTAAENGSDSNYSAIAAAASTYLAAATNQSSVATWYDGSPSGNSQWRGQSMVDPATPAPSSAVVFALGLVFFGIAYEKRRRLRLA